MNKVNLLFIVPSLRGGGAERVVTILLKYIDRSKFNLTLALLKKEGKYLEDIPLDVKVVNLHVKRARYSIFKIIKLVNKEKPDIAFSTLGYLNLIISIMKPFLSKRTVFIGRESNTVSVKNKLEKYPRLFDFLYKNFYLNFDSIIAQANYMKNDLVENYGISSKKITVINNPIDVQKVEKMSKDDIEFIFPKDKINLLAVGKLKHQKGFDNLLNMMSQIDEKYHLTILGEGPDEKSLKEQAKKLNITHRVSMVGFQSNPYAFMKQADIFLLSSRYEGFPNVVSEANLCGIPTIAFNSPGGTEEIVRENNGLLIENNNFKAFEDAVNLFELNKYDEQAIKDSIISRFSNEIIVKIYEKHFIKCWEQKNAK